MKIFSEIQISPHNTPIFVLYLDKQETGDPNIDCFCAGTEYTTYVDCNNPDKLMELITPLLSELIYNAYGESRFPKEPITDWHQTGFDPKCVNGVKGFEIK